MKFRRDLPEKGPSNYLKLKDKESVTGIFRGDVFEFWVIWENGKPRPASEHDYGSRFRFKINFVIKEGASYVVKVFEQGSLVYEQLAALHEEYDLEKTLIKITRKGSGKNDTEYNLMPLKQEVSPETLAVLQTLKLNPLGARDHSVDASAGDNLPWPDRSEEQPYPDLDHDEVPF